MMNSYLLLPIITLIHYGASRDCSSGELRLTEQRHLLQYCYNGTWSPICNLDPVSAGLVCRELGYHYLGVTIQTGECEFPNPATPYFSLTTCNGHEHSIEECSPKELNDLSADGQCARCHYGNRISHVALTCQPADCHDNEVRLVGGASNREGHIEVCLNGRWGSVCNREMGAAACHRLGFPTEGLKVFMNHSSRVMSAVYDCTLEDADLNFSCKNTNTGCNHSMTVGVMCRSHDQVAHTLISRAINITLERCLTTSAVRDDRKDHSVCQNSTETTRRVDIVLGGVSGVVGVVCVISVIGWIVSCWVIVKQKWQFINRYQSDNAIYSTTTHPHQQYSNPHQQYSHLSLTYEQINANSTKRRVGSAYNIITRVQSRIPETGTPTYSVLERGEGQMGVVNMLGEQGEGHERTALKQTDSKV